MIPRLTVIVALLCSAAAARASNDGPIPVNVVKDNQGYHLTRGGEPYFINGAGGSRYLDVLQSHGGNSIRTWGHDQINPREMSDGTVRTILDDAHDRGITVCVGFWMEHPRHGFSYDNKDDVRKQTDEAIAFVRKWKDHPAVLMWGVGNEVALTGNPEQLFREINSLAKAIKAEDPDHPTMTALAGVWPRQGAQFNELCPDVDIMGVNAYSGLDSCVQELLRQGYRGPYVVTEYGPVGHWESALTTWDAAVEQTSSGKARSFRENYDAAVLNQPDRCLGAYAFLWGNKQERTETWYGMFLKSGEKLAAVDTMSHLWTGAWPDNRAPDIDRLVSDALLKRVAPSTEFNAQIRVSDPDGDTLTYRWLVRAESTDHGHGGDSEAAPPEIDGCILSEPASSIRFRTPDRPGAYRLFVYVYDGNGAAGTANLPFFVE